MAKKLRYVLYTFICLLILTVLVSLFLSILYLFNLFSSYLIILSKMFGYLIFIIGGILLGRNIKEKTIFYACGLTFIGIVISLFFIEKNIISILLLISKWFIFIIISLISRNS